MKKTILIFSLLCIFTSFLPHRAEALSPSAQSAVVIDGDGCTVAYEKNAHSRMGMASTTKIMTALVAIENYPLEKEFTVSDKALGVEGSSIYLKKGERFTMKQLLYALLLQSANDAATAIAIEVGGSVENFAVLMNNKADSLELQNTHFTNPHGLYDENHYTTAYDLALITQYALKNPTFKEIVSTYKTSIPLNGIENGRVLVNHNKLLRQYEGAIGVKTGFTKMTGRCLVSAAERDGTTMIAVTLNAPDDWNDHKSMLDHGFEKYKTFHLAPPQSINCKIPVVGGNKSYVNLCNEGGLTYTCDKKTANITKEVVLSRFLFAPVEKNQAVGQIIFYNNGTEIGRVDLLTQDSVEQKHIKKKLFGLF